MAGLLLLFFSIATFAQNTGLQKTIRENDSLFWVAYNHCDIDGMHRFVAEDVEFYHDKGGFQNGWQTFEQTTKRNLCGRADWKIRREAVAGSVKIYPMESNGQVYGAIISGEHKFLITENGQPEYWSGVAKFTHLWTLENGFWKMKRILSFDHQPAPYQTTKKSILLPNKTLKQFQGRYDSKQGVITVAPGNHSLSLTLGGKTYAIYPESEFVFFSKERDLTFEFAKTDDKLSKLIVRENGNIVEQAPILK